MKRKNFRLISLLLITAGIMLSACKSHEKCPAYTKVNSDNPYAKVRSV